MIKSDERKENEMDQINQVYRTWILQMEDQLEDRSSQIYIDEPMSLHTTFKIGGMADLYFVPTSISAVISAVQIAKKLNIPITIMGMGSNLLVSDRGIRGLVICLSKKLQKITLYKAEDLMASTWFSSLKEGQIRGDMYYVEATAGVSLKDLSNFAKDHLLTGLEFCCGIPGSVGGAIYMNAGAYGSSMNDVILATDYIDNENKERTCIGKSHEFDYRMSLFKKEGGTILRTLFMLHPADLKKIETEMEDYTNRRTTSQPLDMPSAGSVFKRPQGHYTGKLITDANLKGYQIGRAMISNKHAGFIVNNGGASALDVLNLIAHIKQTIRHQFAVELETEIQLVGDFLPNEINLIS